MLENILKLTEFTNKFHQIKRTIYIKGTNELESDSEHSFQLALFAWYIIKEEKLNLDMGLIFKFSLVHDLVETYAGDTFAHDNSPEQVADKHQREANALERIENEFKEFDELVDLIRQYETRNSEESKFVYALDKIMPIYNLYIDGGRMWKEKKVTFEEACKIKDDKVKAHPVVEKYWLEIRKLIEEKKGEVFFPS